MLISIFVFIANSFAHIWFDLFGKSNENREERRKFGQQQQQKDNQLEKVLKNKRQNGH